MQILQKENRRKFPFDEWKRLPATALAAIWVEKFGSAGTGKVFWTVGRDNVGIGSVLVGVAEEVGRATAHRGQGPLVAGHAHHGCIGSILTDSIR